MLAYTTFRDTTTLVRTCLISSKIRWILPKDAKESVDLPDFVKESVAQIQILCTFKAGLP